MQNKQSSQRSQRIMRGSQKDILTSVGVKQNQSQQALRLEILTTLESDSKTTEQFPISVHLLLWSGFIIAHSRQPAGASHQGPTCVMECSPELVPMQMRLLAGP